MRLEKIFNEEIKNPEEKSFRKIENDSSMFDEILAFLKNEGYKKTKIKGVSKLECYFLNTMDFLKNFNITNDIPRKFLERVENFKYKKEKIFANEGLTIMLSALIQTSYNQGHNLFEFGDVYVNNFGMFLKGKRTRPMKIKARKLNGVAGFLEVKNYIFEAEEVESDDFGFCSQNFKVFCKKFKGRMTFKFSSHGEFKIKEFDGNWAFLISGHHTIEIENYNGEHFGESLNNSIIYSKNKETLGILKKQSTGEDNEFYIKN